MLLIESILFYDEIKIECYQIIVGSFKESTKIYIACYSMCKHYMCIYL